MTDRSICSLWTLLAAVTLSQLWRGVTGQVPSFSIEVVSSVLVQEGLNASIPCKFTADGRKTFSNSFGYWKLLNSHSIVATNDKSIAGLKNNLYLMGNPDSGDCTLNITDARREDDADYYFRFEEGKVKYSYKDIKTHIIVAGVTGQVPSFSIEVVSSVLVQEGLNASIPCKFTADGRKTFSNSFGYWKLLDSHSIVATNDKSIAGLKNNFYLMGNPDSGDCTLNITDARREDDADYYFRFEEGKVKYSYKDIKTHIIVTGIKERTVFLKGYSIEVNSSVSVQEDLSVTIPCKFTAGGRNTFSNSFGYWSKLYSESVVATNDKSSAGQKPNFNLTGNPDSGDCTLTITDARREDEGIYFFRFQESKASKVKYKYYREVTTTITVTGLRCQVVHSPGYSITVASSVVVQEGLCITIPCNFTADGRNTFNDSFGYWMRMPQHPKYVVATNDESSAAQKPNFNMTGNPDSGDCTLTITDTSREDEGVYYFRFLEGENSEVKYCYHGEMATSITVTGLTEEPIISDFGTLIAGENKTVTCAPPGNCLVKSLAFQWKKSNVAGIWKNSSTITFTPSIEDDQETITCEMTNSRGKTTQKHIPLDVNLPLLKDPKLITGLIIGLIVVVSATVLGIVLLVKRKKKTEPSSPKNHPSNSKTASDEMYENMPKIQKTNKTCTAKKATNRPDKIYMNSIN